MKKLSILFSLFVMVASVSAQEGTDFNPTTKVVPELKKNEISINTAPLFRVLLNTGSPEITRFSATYKRNLSDKSALRFSLMADMINNTNFGYYPEVIILQTDSILIKQSTVSPGYLSPHANIGYERHFGKHKLQWFYGIDLSVGYAKNRTAVQNQTLHRDTTLGTNAWVVVHEYSADIVSKTNRKIFSIGVSPFFGAKYPISKRFSISAQVGFDMTYQNQNIEETKGVVTKKSRVSSFDFNANTGIINDISLIYKF